MRSVRLDDELERRVTAAAQVRGETVSEFLRQAAAERAAATLGSDGGFDDVIGVVRSEGGRARRTGEAFAEGLRSDRRRR